MDVNPKSDAEGRRLFSQSPSNPSPVGQNQELTRSQGEQVKPVVQPTEVGKGDLSPTPVRPSEPTSIQGIEAQFTSPPPKAGKKGSSRSSQRPPLPSRLVRSRKRVPSHQNLKELGMTDRLTAVLNQLPLGSDCETVVTALFNSCNTVEELRAARRILDYLGPMTNQYASDIKDAHRKLSADYVLRIRRASRDRSPTDRLEDI